MSVSILRRKRGVVHVSLATAVVAIGLPGLSLAATRNVPADYPTIQACIDAAVSRVDECVVAPGTYHERINFLGKAITVRSSGGRDATTIDATGLGGSVVTCISHEGPNTVLDGFWITGGTGTDRGGWTAGGGMLNTNSSPRVGMCTFDGNTANRGGGMYNDNSSPSVSQCTFSGNTANWEGGGMYNDFISAPTVFSNLFNSNSADRGGGMYNYVFSAPTLSECGFYYNTANGEGGGMHNESSTPEVTNCMFRGNTATNDGGGMFNRDGSSPAVTDCTFSENTGSWGGGMRNANSSPTVTDCTFSGNTANSDGGGMHNSDGSSPAVTDCTFSANTARLGGGMLNGNNSRPAVARGTFDRNRAIEGGGIFNANSSPTVTDCTFSANRASWGGGMINMWNSSPTVTNCTFSGNTANNDGGGMFNRDGSPAVTNCTFSGNTANGKGGGMLNVENSSPSLSNCILWGDTPDEVRNDDGGSAPTTRFSDMRGGLPVGAVDGGGNIVLEPTFVRSPSPGPDGRWGGADDDYGDLRLQPGSPCIGTGDPDYLNDPNATGQDLDGNPRVVGGRVDMGAYEFQGACDGPDFDGDGLSDDCDPDIDNDGVPNVLDRCNFTPNGVTVDDKGRPLADLNGDCAVDLRDFAILQRDLFGPQ